MLVSSIRGADSLNFNPNITANSFNRIKAVKEVVKQPQEQQADEFILSESAAELLQPALLNQDSQNSSAKDAGKSYGMNANELRNEGMLYQLMGQEVADQPDVNVMGNAPVKPALPNPVLGETEDSASAVTTPQTDEYQQDPPKEAEEEKTPESTRPNGPDGEPLTDEEARMVDELEARDMEVRTHEQAHIAASGGYSSGSASFSYQKGPNGQRYAVGGEVQIDTSPEATPEATIQKMQTVRQAALAPAQPSGQDRAVAAAASQAEMEARQKMQEESAEKLEGSEEDKEPAEAAPAEEAATDKTKPQGMDYANADNYQNVQDQNPAAAAEAAPENTPAPLPEMNPASAIGSASLSYTQSAARIAYGISA